MSHAIPVPLVYAWTLVVSATTAATIVTKSGMTVTGDIEGFLIQQGEAATGGGRASIGYALIKASDIVAIDRQVLKS
jgi:predicted RNA methylase